MDRPMNGWAKGGRHWTSRWHQVEFDSRFGVATLRCSGKRVEVGGEAVMDYRWRPPLTAWCYHPPCREDVPA